MVFREPSPPPPIVREGHVVHGPFQARHRPLLFGVGALFLGMVLLFAGLMKQHLVCPSAGICTIDERPAFDRADLRGAHVVIEIGSKGAKYGVLVLDLDGHRERRMMKVDPDDAEAARAAIEGAIGRDEPIDQTLHGQRVLALVGAAGIVAFFILWWLAFAKMGRFDLRASNGKLEVRRSLFGFPLRAHTISIERVSGVVVERSQVSQLPRNKYEGPLDAGRLVLVYDGPPSAPLSEAFFPGRAVHLRAAATLRRALALPANLADDAELAKIPMRTTPTRDRLMWAWPALCVGALLGLALLGVSLWALGFLTPRQNIQGWMVAAGMIPGAIAGVAFVFHLTRPRLPR